MADENDFYYMDEDCSYVCIFCAERMYVEDIKSHVCADVISSAEREAIEEAIFSAEFASQSFSPMMLQSDRDIQARVAVTLRGLLERFGARIRNKNDEPPTKTP